MQRIVIREFLDCHKKLSSSTETEVEEKEKFFCSFTSSVACCEDSNGESHVFSCATSVQISAAAQADNLNF